MLAGTLLRFLHRLRLIPLPHLGNLVVQRVVRVRGRQQRLDREQHGSDLQRGAPLVFEDVQADAADLVDVGMVHLRQEAHLWRRHRVLLGQEELQAEDASLVRRPGRPLDDD
eukprot:CAMPEP_0185288548 /NCGR_PEP_ID=MMETSP1363-20130426/3459_1 /TAXON_ID=38817 /ORGANISM="Gephyrocapsa oceanica, Strain RCC1303" /LENGTH=111 /DNA_ID=CAMNT_0027884427 /DNA_START=356 /DNA_END=691 /DNA_ORIENTATION=+